MVICAVTLIDDRSLLRGPSGVDPRQRTVAWKAISVRSCSARGLAAGAPFLGSRERPRLKKFPIHTECSRRRHTVRHRIAAAAAL